MKYFLETPAGRYEAEVDGRIVRLDGLELRPELRKVGEGRRFLIRLDGRTAVGFARRLDDAWEVNVEGLHVHVRVEDERRHHIRTLVREGSAPVPRELRAPMPGLIVRVDVAAGEEVRPDQPLIVMEAMKMENELRSEAEAVVASVAVEAGQTVDRGDLLLTFDSK